MSGQNPDGPLVRYTATIERTTTYIVAFTGPAGLDDADVRVQMTHCINHRHDDEQASDASRQEAVRELQDDDRIAGPVTRTEVQQLGHR